MAFAARIEADSISNRGYRLVTFVITLPRIMLAEFNTHGTFSRNSASSRAIPLWKQLLMLLEDMFVPAEFGTDVGGMQAGPILTGKKHDEAVERWINAGFDAMMSALRLATSERFIEQRLAKWQAEHGDDLRGFIRSIAMEMSKKKSVINKGASMKKTTKGLINRLLEPFMWHTIIVTATEWSNFFALRTHNDAQLEIRTIAKMMKAAYDGSTPTLLREGEWHLPFIQPEEREWAVENPLIARRAVIARCARVSYLTHDKKELDLEADLKLADRLDSGGHMSPFEHAATPFTDEEWHVRSALQQTVRELSHSLTDYMVDELLKSTEFSQKLRGWGPARREQPHQDDYAEKLRELQAAA